MRLRDRGLLFAGAVKPDAMELCGLGNSLLFPERTRRGDKIPDLLTAVFIGATEARVGQTELQLGSVTSLE